jgi:hypothetical protein
VKGEYLGTGTKGISGNIVPLSAISFFLDLTGFKNLPGLEKKDAAPIGVRKQQWDFLE